MSDAQDSSSRETANNGRPSDRARIRRNAVRADYEKDTALAILDAGQICQVAWVDAGEPRIIPTLYMRKGNYVYLHGNRQSAMLRHAGGGGLVCVSVTLTDGAVVARSGFHCSMNYRSITVFGHGEQVDAKEHKSVLDTFVDALIPGHRAAVRAPTRQELAATAAVRVPIDDFAAKVRSGDPIDDQSDLDADCWAGVVPWRLVAGPPVPSANLSPGIDVPGYIADYCPQDSFPANTDRSADGLDA